MSLPILVELAYCSHCGCNPGVKPHTDEHDNIVDGGCVWRGFYDADTSEYVCWNCVRTHYEKKAISEHRGKYSEMPVTINSPDPTSESSPLIELSKLR